MIQDTAAAAGLDSVQHDTRGQSTTCSGGSTSAESLELIWPSISSAQAQSIAEEIAGYWRSQAPEWAKEGFDVDDKMLSISQTVYLEIDGYSMSATFTPAGPDFSINGSAPCVEPTDSA